MKSTTYLLVGGGLASAEAIKQIRRLNDSARVTLVADEDHLPYNRPPLSKGYLRGEEQRENILVSPADFYAENAVETVLGVTAQGLDPAQATVSLSNGDSIHYEKLLIATGGSPVRLKVPGADNAGAYYLRSVDDAEAIAAEAQDGRQAVIVGAGFIGMEVAASLTQKGVKVTVLEALPRVWPLFADESLADFVRRYCEERGVTFHTGDAVEAFLGDGRVTSVRTRSGRELPCDFACIGVGIRPRVELAVAGGLKTDNGIVVDERMHTSHPNIYAAGDVVNYPDPVFGKRRRVEHWGHAEHTGQVAGRNMAGEETSYDLLTYVWSDIFDLHVEFAGDEAEHDQSIVRGDMAAGSFTILYLKDGLLRAYFAVNTPAREYPIFQRLIKRKKDLAGSIAELQDPSFSVRSLL
ncbi:MAG: NAD(P)/FAD-dependent oxidoreductase [Chloroflexi bacterium]|nr:NAD(P)/FAD-dependent oxidoreductase [Chloroflexota bacterium]